MEEIIFPNQIRMFRRARGCSMQELADFLGISLSAVSKIEKGYRRVDQEQLVRIAKFLDCPLQEIFVNEATSPPDVVQAWRREQERRSGVNESGGLKKLGAALRYLRSQSSMTLADIAEKSKLTLSVYHRIEMGQREVTDEEYTNITAALGMSDVAALKAKVDELFDGGALDEFIKRNEVKYRIATHGLEYVDFSAGSSNERKISVYGTPAANGNIAIDKANALAEEKCPVGLLNVDGAYGVRLCSRRLGNVLPTRATLFIDPYQMVGLGDIALMYVSETEVKVVSVREDLDGKLVGLQRNPDEKVEIDNQDASTLHRVVSITMG
ncbi:MAG: transcriptional regulator [Alphaproteobacteria bacterium]|nr:transcriptional regulator [Alphaproteobacteria bacterium]